MVEAVSCHSSMSLRHGADPFLRRPWLAQMALRPSAIGSLLPCCQGSTGMAPVCRHVDWAWLRGRTVVSASPHPMASRSANNTARFSRIAVCTRAAISRAKSPVKNFLLPTHTKDVQYSGRHLRGGSYNMARILSVIRIAASLNPMRRGDQRHRLEPWVGRYRAGRIPTIGRRRSRQGQRRLCRVNASVASRMPLCSVTSRRPPSLPVTSCSSAMTTARLTITR